MTKAVTLKDIAREIGVHVSTVSRALDPNARTSLTDEVVRRVRTTADKMGYRPNRLASGLTVGMMLPDITNTLFPPIVRGVESVLEPLGYASIIVNTDSDAAREAKLVDVLLERGVDGIIDIAAQRSDPHIDTVARQGLPVVTANRRTDSSEIPSVSSDDAGGIRMMVEYLYNAGHRRIAHIAGPQALSTGQLRLETFVNTMRDHGLECDPSSVAVAARFDEDEGRRCTVQILQNMPNVTALLCANDRLALGAIDLLHKRGLSCPKDVSVTGFNDIPFLDLIPPGLTTIRVQHFDVGRLSAEILVKKMTEPNAAIPLTTVLPVRLIERGSVAILPV